MLWIAKLPSPSFRAGQYRNSARSAGFGNRTMYSFEPQPTCPSRRKSTYAVFPFLRQGMRERYEVVAVDEAHRQAKRVAKYTRVLAAPVPAVTHRSVLDK
jgi:hypothetical protein